MITMTHVAGKDKGSIKLFALSTCVWCKKTKKLLNELGVAYDYADVDLLDVNEAEAAQAEIKKWNPPCSFPTMVINNKKCIIGYDEGKINQELS